MNELQYRKEIADKTLDPKKDIINLRVDLIKVPAKASQVRKSGTQTSHKRSIKASLDSLGQVIPITVEKGLNGDYVLVAGHHRLDAAKDLGWITIKAVIKLFKSPENRLLYQIEENEHLPALPNCQATIEATLSELIQIHRVFDVNRNFPSQDEVYTQVRKRKLYPNLHHGTLKAILKSIYKSSTLLATTHNNIGYEKDTTALAKFKAVYKNAQGKQKWDGDAPGDISNNTKVFFIGSELDARNTLANSCVAKIKNPQVKTVGCIWLNELFGKDDDDIKEARDAMYKKINDANNAWFVIPGFSYIDEMVFLPQKSHEDPDKLLSVAEVIKAPPLISKEDSDVQVLV